MAERFAQQTAVVTGAASGIGRAIARRFVAEGGRVAAGDIDAAGLESLQSELGDSVATVRGDVTSEADVEALVATCVDRFGAVHVGFNVAGASRPALIVDLTEDDWDFTVDLCLKGVFFGIKHQARRMIAAGSGGSIVNIASLNSRVPMFFGSAYAAAKAGVVSLGQSASLELGEHGIRVATVSPGLTDTPLVAGLTGIPWTASRCVARPDRRTSPPPRCSWPAPTAPTSPGRTCSSTAAGSRPRTRTCGR
jgi:meso-butanediol dehydrogenase/(S,S)-butanediol dehydrogenase/diacetyl reductase